MPLREGAFTGCPSLVAWPLPAVTPPAPCCARSRLRFVHVQAPDASGHVSRPRRAGYFSSATYVICHVIVNMICHIIINREGSRWAGDLRGRPCRVRCGAPFVAGCVRRHPGFEALLLRQAAGAKRPAGTRPGPRSPARRLAVSPAGTSRAGSRRGARHSARDRGGRSGPVSPPPGASRPAAGASPAR